MYIVGCTARGAMNGRYGPADKEYQWSELLIFQNMGIRRPGKQIMRSSRCTVALNILPRQSFRLE